MTGIRALGRVFVDFVILPSQSAPEQTILRLPPRAGLIPVKSAEHAHG
jgi:hypothetical protein